MRTISMRMSEYKEDLAGAQANGYRNGFYALRHIVYEALHKASDEVIFEVLENEGIDEEHPLYQESLAIVKTIRCHVDEPSKAKKPAKPKVEFSSNDLPF